MLGNVQVKYYINHDRFVMLIQLELAFFKLQIRDEKCRSRDRVHERSDMCWDLEPALRASSRSLALPALRAGRAAT